MSQRYYRLNQSHRENNRDSGVSIVCILIASAISAIWLLFYS